MTNNTLNTPSQTSTAGAIILEQAVIGRAGLALTNPINLTLRPGTVTVVQGPNGIGKTTFLRVLAGLLPVMRGAIRAQIFGNKPTPVTPFDARWMANVAWLPVSPGLPPSLTPYDVLAQLGRLGGAGSRPDTDRAISNWGLDHLVDMPIQYLSAGQRRRVDLARLTLDQRPIWLLDEPAVTLDSQGRDRLGAAIDQHRAAGGMIVMASHDTWQHSDWQRITLTPDSAAATVTSAAHL
ncbi:MAG: heme ABC exporter ATP-binding protein CcmA [Pseudomonadota bacterium]